jgi:hypothetical protein
MNSICKEQIKEYPFKHIKFENSALNKTLYDKLASSFPELSKEKQKKKKRYDMNLHYIRKHEMKLNDEWFRFINMYTSMSFFKKLCSIFDVDSTEFNTISIRKDKRKTDIEVDLQFAYNLQNETNINSFIRAPHADKENKIFVILLYFPYLDKIYHKNDNGSLLLYKNNDVVDTIPYNHNNGIVFMNSDNAFHAPLTLLNHKDEMRRFINIIFIDKTIPKLNNGI